nr:FlaG family protein [Helicobacter sp. 12S02232-10]
MDNIQGSSFSSLQNKLVGLVNNAGKPVGIDEHTQIPIAKQNQEIDTYHSNRKKDELKQELILLSGELNKEMKRINTDINFNYNDDIRGLVVTVKEVNGDKIIREIPSKEAIELMKKMHDIVGLIFDKKG